jgi:hypothetical protein
MKTNKEETRRHSVHSTTLKERQAMFRIACLNQYRTNEGLGSRKRQFRQLKSKDS